jgi:hypothetical protein
VATIAISSATVDRAHRLIDQIGVGRDHLGAGKRLFLETPAHLVPALAIGALENLQHLRLDFLRVAGPGDQLVETGDQGLAVDDVARFANVTHGAIPAGEDDLKLGTI